MLQNDLGFCCGLLKLLFLQTEDGRGLEGWRILHLLPEQNVTFDVKIKEYLRSRCFFLMRLQRIGAAVTHRRVPAAGKTERMSGGEEAGLLINPDGPGDPALRPTGTIDPPAAPSFRSRLEVQV